MTKVLEGVLILDLGRVLVGPVTGMLLADLGAEVIKVENPNGGDQFRAYEAGFGIVNKNKKSLCLDLRSSLGREALLRLAERADVLLENFRPGVMERLGMGMDVLHARNARLIVCSITGFGSEGPYHARPAYDTGIMALSGFMSLLVDPERPAATGPPIADGITALYACYGILGALLERERTGVGRKIDLNMVESLIAFTHQAFGHYFTTGIVQGPTTRARIAQAYVMKCADGKLIGMHLSSPDKEWQGLLTTVESAEMTRDPRFQTYEGRVQHYDTLRQMLAEKFLRHPQEYWMARLQENDVPFAPVYRNDEVLADPHIRELGTFYEFSGPQGETFKAIRRPVAYDGDREVDTAPAPALGQHSEQILGELGFSEEEIAELTGPGNRE